MTFDKLKEKVKKIRKELSVLVLAYKDKRTPLLAKLLLGLTIGYMLSPIDLIPDFIPVLGLLDDLIIVPLLIRLSVRLIPKQVLADARQQLATASPQKKNTSWIGAAIVITIWIATIILVYKWITAP